MVITISQTMDLVYSQDELGWYFQEYTTNLRERISQLFKTQTQARVALVNHEIKWRKL